MNSFNNAHFIIYITGNKIEAKFDNSKDEKIICDYRNMIDQSTTTTTTSSHFFHESCEKSSEA